MFDRLYCPDFSAIFGPNWRNPYDYPMIDSLVWPTFIDIDLPPEGKKLLEISQDGHHPLFYRRKITIAHLITELKCSNLEGACIQAIDLGRDYGIPSSVVLECAKKYPKILLPILSPAISKEGVALFKKQVKDAVAAVIYPSYQKIDLANPSAELEEILSICHKEKLPIKIDLGNMYLPDNDQSNCTPEKVRRFVNMYSQQPFILSGIDIMGNGAEIINILRYDRNCSIEFDPRTFGGITPELFFSKIFQMPGVIQNCWGRILLGSSTPMLESSQVTRGWWAATEKLPFAQQCLLRTWMYRNIHRICRLKIPPIVGIKDTPEIFAGKLEAPKVIKKSEDELFISQDLSLNSSAITQLLYITPYILEAASSLTKKYAEYPYGEFKVKSYHTTTSLIINEHEFGNYLQIHYDCVVDTMANAADKLHTLAAEENRADFNYPDHITASTRGVKDYSATIMDGKIQLGGRENIYILVTFGPRAIKLNLQFKLFKGNPVD